jgi:hypothetical protein
LTRYEVKLSEQEVLNLRQLMTQPGSDALMKLLQGESLDAQTYAMECTDPDEKKRLLLLTDAQATRRVVSNLTRKLFSYREMNLPAPTTEAVAEVIDNIWEQT